MRRFIDWIAHYTIAPPGMVLKSLLRTPAALDPEQPLPGLAFTGDWPERMSAARERVKELIDAATAAPTLYPPVGIRESESRWLIDGAIATNDPSVIAISEALAMGYALENIWVISLGTGHPEHDLSQEECDAIGNEAKHWGMVEWVAYGLFDHMMTGSASISEYQCRQLLGDR